MIGSGIPLLEEHPELPPEIRRAWTLTVRGSEPGPGFRVGICDAGGRVIAGTLLGSMGQLSAFARRLEKLGYFAQAVPADVDAQECDVLFVPGAQPT